MLPMYAVLLCLWLVEMAPALIICDDPVQESGVFTISKQMLKYWPYTHFLGLISELL